jgi:hypothetical protein
MSGVIALQLAQLQQRFTGTHVQHLPSGILLVIVPDVLLPEGWNKPSATIRFTIPSGYPYAQLDCFWIDPDVLLATGAQPQNTGPTPIPETNEPALWFSWHLKNPWDPNRDTLSTWMSVILNRMEEIR